MEHRRDGELPRHEQGHDHDLGQIRPPQGLPHRPLLAHPAAGRGAFPRRPAAAAPGPAGLVMMRPGGSPTALATTFAGGVTGGAPPALVTQALGPAAPAWRLPDGAAR